VSSLRRHPSSLAILVTGALMVLAACAEGVEPAPLIRKNDASSSVGGNDEMGGNSGAGSTTTSAGGSGGGGAPPSAEDSGSAGSADQDATPEASADDSGGDAVAEVGPADTGNGGSGGASADSGPQGPMPILDYKFDQTVGSVVIDSSGGDHNGTISGGVTWVAGRKGNAIKLDGVNGFVLLPPGIVSALTDMTLTTWVELEVAADWQRIIDFGNNGTVQMFLVPQNKETGVMRFVLTIAGKAGQQLVNGPSPLPVGVWKHVAVVLKGATATLYVDGTSVASMGGFTLHPSSMGSTANNWIGRSQNSADPYFKGMFDDFRIYDRALTTAEIVAIVAN